jgi:hypothetical protein
MEMPNVLPPDVREEKASLFLADSAKRRNLSSWGELLLMCGAMEGIYSVVAASFFFRVFAREM